MARRGFFILGLGILGIVALAMAARQTLLREPLTSADEVIFETSYTLSGMRETGMVVVAEAALLEAGSRTAGDVALVTHSARIEGVIEGDLTVLAELVEIGPEAVIQGNATLLSDEAILAGSIEGTLNVRADTLQINDPAQFVAGAYACNVTLVDTRAEPLPLADCDESDLMSSTRTLEALRDPNFVLPLLNITISGAAVAIMASAVGSLALSGLSILAVIVFPRQISHIEEAVRLNPRGLGGTGIMILALAAGITGAVALLLVAIPPLGFIAVPLYLLVALGFFGMGLAGWITIALIAGDLILQRIGVRRVPPLIIAALGNVTLLAAWNILALNEYSRICAFIVLAGLGSVGLGAAYITRVGTRPVHRSYLIQG